MIAPPSGPSASTSADTSAGRHTSSRSRGAITYVDVSDDDIKMEEQDDEQTPRRTRTTGKKRAITSPGKQGPAAQRARVGDPVHDNHCFMVSKLISRHRMAVGHADEQIVNVCPSPKDLLPSRACTAPSRRFAAIPWQSGPMNLPRSPSRPRKRHLPRKRQPASSRRERVKSGMPQVRTQ